MRREDIERILAKYPFIKPPDQVYILNAPVAILQLKAIAKGLSPKGRDLVVLTPQADEETVLHETVHTYGFGEIAANIVPKVLMRLRSVLPPIVRKQVVYEEIDTDHRELEGIGLEPVPKPNKPLPVKKLVLKEERWL